MENIASKILHKFGGAAKVSKLLNLDRTGVYRWQCPKEKGGTGGIIPARHQTTLMAKAKELGVDLSPNDFFDLPETKTPRKKDTQ